MKNQHWDCAVCGSQHLRKNSFRIAAGYDLTMQLCAPECLAVLRIQVGLAADMFQFHARKGGGWRYVRTFVIRRSLLVLKTRRST